MFCLLFLNLTFSRVLLLIHMFSLERQKLMISVNNLLFKKLQKPLILLMLLEMMMFQILKVMMVKLLNQLQKEVMAKSMKMILN
mmetsp:Transcript_10571/g.29877  ORF Transcript_10571/g.29877 Transcript_10571/m.29877 type:complete len:84 (-) Transcript_10571:140-391(-)